MFDSKKYVTSGINAEVPIQVQMVLWDLIDSITVKKDYLQVFNFIKKGDVLKIIHTQEQPNYNKSIDIKSSDVCCNLKEYEKIFCIDDGDYSTMLFASEY